MNDNEDIEEGYTEDGNIVQSCHPNVQLHCNMVELGSDLFIVYVE